MIFRSSVVLLLCVLSANALAETESFVFYRQDTQIGRLVVEVNGNAAKKISTGVEPPWVTRKVSRRDGLVTCGQK